MTDRTRSGAVFILIFAGVISALQIGKAAIAVPMLQRELPSPLLAASLIVGAYGVLGAVAGLPAGILSSLISARTTDRGAHGRRYRKPRRCIRRKRRDPDRDAGLEGCGSLAAALAVPRLLRTVTAPKHLEQVLAMFAAHLPLGSVVMMLAGRRR